MLKVAQGGLEIGCIVTVRLAATTKTYMLFGCYQELILFCKFVFTLMLLIACLVRANLQQVDSRLAQTL